MEEKKAQTPKETAQELSDMAEKLEEMDKAEGVFGEAIADVKLDDVAGGLIIPTKCEQKTGFWFTCSRCGKYRRMADTVLYLCSECWALYNKNPRPWKKD